MMTQGDFPPYVGQIPHIRAMRVIVDIEPATDTADAFDLVAELTTDVERLNARLTNAVIEALGLGSAEIIVTARARARL